MRIVVTGGNGLVGNSIKAIVYQYPQHEFIFITRDMCELSSLPQVISFFSRPENKFDYIIHLAAKVGGLFMNLDSNVEMFSENIKINENILFACKKYGVKRGIFCLSSCIYPCNPNRFPMDESMIHESPPHHSNEGYAYAKRMLELQCRQYNKAYGTEYICVIPVNLYGPYDNFSIKNGHVIPAIMNRFHGEKAKKDGKFTVYGTGRPYRQFLFARDFAKIMCDVLLDEKYDNTEPIICCNDETTIKEMVGTLADAMDIGRKKLEWDTNKSDGCMKKTVDNSKLCKYYPGFKFTSLQDGLKETYRWFCASQETLRQ